jgi:hypothetical protein
VDSNQSAKKSFVKLIVVSCASPEDHRMSTIVDNPFVVSLVALVAQWCAAYAGDLLRRKVRPLVEKEREDFNTVLTATLTLLALIIGFSFSMAVSRYDQRKDYEEAEANAIGTEYLRADLLPANIAPTVRVALVGYLHRRIAFYEGAWDPSATQSVESARSEAELWSAVARAGAEQPTSPVVALAIAGMNDVLNSQGYTQAAWLNRIPIAAWALMVLIALFANLLLGYRERQTGMIVLTILPVIVSIAFFLIADIDSPIGGGISVAPQNLISLERSLKAAPPK